MQAQGKMGNERPSWLLVGGVTVPFVGKLFYSSESIPCKVFFDNCRLLLKLHFLLKLKLSDVNTSMNFSNLGYVSKPNSIG